MTVRASDEAQGSSEGREARPADATSRRSAASVHLPSEGNPSEHVAWGAGFDVTGSDEPERSL